MLETSCIVVVDNIDGVDTCDVACDSGEGADNSMAVVSSRLDSRQGRWCINETC